MSFRSLPQNTKDALDEINRKYSGILREELLLRSSMTIGFLTTWTFPARKHLILLSCWPNLLSWESRAQKRLPVL